MKLRTIKSLYKKGITKVLFLLTLSVLVSCTDSTDNTEEIIDITPSAIAAFSETVDVNDFRIYSFTDRSTNASTYAWDFGDGNVSNEAEPTNTFSQAGKYTVSLTVSNGSSDPDTVEKTIEVINPNAPVVDFSFAVDSKDWLTYTFTNASTNAVSYVWDFGDNTTSTDTEPTKTYSAEGDYIVTLTATSSFGDSTTLEQTVSVVDPAIVASFEAVILNGSIDEFTGDKNDNNDAWELDPPNTLKDGSTSPYTWDNQSLEESGSSKFKAAGITTTENTGVYALKFDSNIRRAYQPFKVEAGVEYTISMFVRTETTDDFTIYMLNNEVADENDLSGNSDTVFVVSGNNNTYQEYTFTYTATSSTSVFYAVPFNDINSDSEVYLDDISIKTSGF
ncbi:MAG: PKD domain-containing protein [Polaribacter sp.]|uniref:PKD domain-containing protein n=1 Tax=Polaribacter sp. TaxID=1920175 RepID=UPI00326540B6